MTTDHDIALFKQAMASSFPSGVTIVTTTDAAGRWWGFTATSFCSVSTDPPLVLVCLAATAECHPVFGSPSGGSCTSCTPSTPTSRCGSPPAKPTSSPTPASSPTSTVCPFSDRACVTLTCSPYARYAGGDHTILVGRVAQTHIGDDVPTVYFRKSFHALRLLS